MPDIQITIPTPTITGTKRFRVRYSANNGTTWTTVVPDQTNAPFTITGLTPGSYLLEFAVIDGLILCPAVIRTFEVVPEFTCWEFTASFFKAGNLLWFEVSYTPGVVPACGWFIEYNTPGAANPTVVPYATLPASPFKIPVPIDDDYELRIIANLCNGNRKICLDGEFSPTVICAPLVLTAATLTSILPLDIVLNFTNSNPVTNPIFAIWHQTGPMTTGVPDPGGSGILNPVISGGNGTLVIPVNANTTPQNNTITYDVKIIDVCGVEHTATVSVGL
jgi:hypothetical protein